MPSDRKPSLILAVAVTLALLLLAGYVGAYYWCVTPGPLGPYYGDRFSGDVQDDWEERLFLFFRPAHWLDLRIRPHIWGP